LLPPSSHKVSEPFAAFIYNKKIIREPAIIKIIDMKKFCILLIALFMMNFATGQWVPQNSGTTTNLRSVYFTDEDTGFVLRENGIILKTVNGGTTWIMSTSGVSGELLSVFFTDKNTGYVVGDGGTILKTTNGGYPVGTNEITSRANTLIIYLNPASTILTIETPTNGFLSILNLSGQQFITRQITETKTQIDISTLPIGVYVVKQVGEKGVQVGKVIKQ
jgi:hypothetical protein